MIVSCLICVIIIILILQVYHITLKEVTFVMKRFIALLIVLTMLSATPAFAAEWKQGADGTPQWDAAGAEAYTGTYYLSSMMGLSVEMLAALDDDPAAADQLKNLFILNILEDGTGSLSSDGDAISLIWNAAGDQITLVPPELADKEGETFTCTVNGGVITMDIDGLPIVLTKEGTDVKEQPQAEAPVNDGVIPGTYKLHEVLGMSAAQYAALMGATLEEAQNVMVIELKEDGSGSLTADGEATPLTWTSQDNTILLTSEGETISVTIESGILTMDLDGEVIKLGKVS